MADAPEAPPVTLLPCPFCGNATFLDTERDATIICGDEDHWVRCDTCEATGPRTRYGCRDEDEAATADLEQEARLAWNDRGQPEEVLQEWVRRLPEKDRALDAIMTLVESALRKAGIG